MKKLTAFLLVSSLLLSSPSHALELNQVPLPITVNANGKMVISDAEPTVIDGRTLLPLRAAAEALNAEVDWNESANQAIITKDNITLVFTVNKKSFTKNGKTIALDVPLKTQNNRIYLPVRAFSEALNVQTHWDGVHRIVSLGEKENYDKSNTPLPYESDFIINKYTPNPSSDPLVGTWVSADEDNNNSTQMMFIHPIKENNYKLFILELSNLTDPENAILDLWYNNATFNPTNHTLTIKEEGIKYSRGSGHSYPTPTTYFSKVTDSTITAFAYIDSETNRREQGTGVTFQKL